MKKSYNKRDIETQNLEQNREREGGTTRKTNNMGEERWGEIEEMTGDTEEKRRREKNEERGEFGI